MVSTPTAVLGYELQGQNDNSGVWWNNANQVFQVVEDSIAKELAVATTGGDTTLTLVNYAADQSRVAIIRIGAGQTLLSDARVFTQRPRVFFVTNETSAGSFAVKFGGNSSNTVTIPRGCGAFVRVRSDNTTTFASAIINLSTGKIDGGSLASGAFLLGASNLSDLASAPTGRTNLGVIGSSAHGDADVTLSTADIPLAVTSAALTTTRTWTLPLANAVPAGEVLTILDAAGGISATNTLTIQRQGSDTLVGLGTASNAFVLKAARVALVVISDGTSKWSVAGAWLASLDIDGTLAANSDTRVASQKATKTYVDTGLAGKQNSLGFTPLNAASNLTDVANATTSRQSLGVDYATQSDEETGTTTTKVVTPGRQQFHPMHAKAGGRLSSDGNTLTNGFGISATTKFATGSYRITLSQAMSDSNYFVLATGLPTNGSSLRLCEGVVVESTTQFSIYFATSNGNALIDAAFGFAVFGDMP